MNKEEVKLDDESVIFEDKQVFIGDAPYKCFNLDCGGNPHTYALETDTHGIEHVNVIGEDEAYQAELNANGKNANINYLLDRFVGGDPTIAEAVEAGLKFVSDKENSGAVDDSYSDGMILLEKYQQAKNDLNSNYLMSEFIQSNGSDILDDKKKFFEKWDAFVKSKIEASKPKEVDTNEQK